MSVVGIVKTLSTKLDEAALPLGLHKQYFEGAQPLAFLNKTDAEALKGRLSKLPINYCRLVVETLADRLIVEGINTGTDQPTTDLWTPWRRAGLVELSDQAHRVALIYGRCPISVWSAPGGGVSVAVESPTSCAVAGGVALKRWQADDLGHATLFTPDQVVRLVTVSPVPVGGVLPTEGWRIVERIPHRLGRLPVVELVNRQGTSELVDIEPLVDALTKCMTDSMVTAEFGARPRRYTVGLDIKEDENGNPVNPFIDSPNRVWQIEGDPQSVKLDQLDGAPLSPYTDLAAVLVQQIAALAALPPHLAGIRQDQPASAEALRAAESALSARARARQRAFSAAWSDVAKLVYEVATGRPAPTDVTPIWTDPETSSPAQQADAITKLFQAGLLSIDGALDRLGLSPEEIANERIRRRAGALDQAAFGMLSRGGTA